MSEDSTFGVQSLEQTMTDGSLTRSTSNGSDRSASVPSDLSPGKRRRAGNRVHPTILATGQRIISSDRGFSIASPSTSESPFKNPFHRRASGESSANTSQPLTPIKLSPSRAAASPSTPRSGSPKSFRLSDEDGSIAEDSHSQAVQSSSGEEDIGLHLERTPQLVMPSLSMPVRRPFTEQGRRIGRSKIMVVGPRRVGKTSFIQSLFRSSEDIVHMDQITPSVPSSSSFATESLHYIPTTLFSEIQASTRPYPAWWTDAESGRSWHRRLSIGDGVLDRNLSFVDTPGLDNDEQIQSVLNHLKLTLRRTAHMESMSDSELIGLLSGEGGVQVDAVFYLFEPELWESPEEAYFGLSVAHQELLSCLCKWTNFIPLIGRADSASSEDLNARRGQIHKLFELLQAIPYDLFDVDERDKLSTPPAVSFALGDDSDEVDASVLMSSQYLRPLVCSQLGEVVKNLLEPNNVARMRHIAGVKFLLWRQENLGLAIGPHDQAALGSPMLGYDSRVTSSNSLLEDPSKVLVPHSTSSYYRSASPAISDISGQAANVTSTSAYALAKYNEQAPPAEPFRQVRLAKWAQDLQRSLDKERRKYQQMYTNRPSGWPQMDGENNDQALVATKRGRLGGELGVIDPRDPLGVLAFGQAVTKRGVILLQLVGGCGLLGAVAYWVVRNWVDLSEYIGLGQTPAMVTTTAIPPPPRPAAWFDEGSLRGLFGWGR